MNNLLFYSISKFISEEDYARFCMIHARCETGSDLSIYERGGAEKYFPNFRYKEMKSSIGRGRRLNALMYSEKGSPLHIENPFSIKVGDWIACIRFKQTGLFPVAIVESVLNDVRKGLVVEWEHVSSVDRASNLFPSKFEDALTLKNDPQNLPVIFFELVCVLPGLRGSGLVRQLLSATIEQLKTEGIKYIVVYSRIPQFYNYIKEHTSLFRLLCSRLSRNYEKQPRVY